MANYLVVTLMETAQSLLWSLRTELFKLIELYLGEHLEMAGHSVVRLEGKDFLITVEVFLDTELFELLDLYSGDGLGINAHHFRSPRM